MACQANVFDSSASSASAVRFRAGLIYNGYTKFGSVFSITHSKFKRSNLVGRDSGLRKVYKPTFIPSATSSFLSPVIVRDPASVPTKAPTRNSLLRQYRSCESSSTSMLKEIPGRQEFDWWQENPPGHHFRESFQKRKTALRLSVRISRSAPVSILPSQNSNSSSPLLSRPVDTALGTLFSILMMFRHALRVGELVDLKWDQLDLDNAKFHVNRQSTTSKETKSEHSESYGAPIRTRLLSLSPSEMAPCPTTPSTS